MASALNGQIVSTTPTKIFDRDRDGNCKGYLVGCNPSSSNPALVNVNGLHTDGEWFPIAIGGQQEFKASIKEIWAKGNGGNTILDGGKIEN